MIVNNHSDIGARLKLLEEEKRRNLSPPAEPALVYGTVITDDALAEHIRSFQRCKSRFVGPDDADPDDGSPKQRRKLSKSLAVYQVENLPSGRGTIYYVDHDELEAIQKKWPIEEHHYTVRRIASRPLIGDLMKQPLDKKALLQAWREAWIKGEPTDGILG